MEDRADNLESVLRRVRKLLAIAEDSRANAEEASAAAAMAERGVRGAPQGGPRELSPDAPSGGPSDPPRRP